MTVVLGPERDPLFVPDLRRQSHHDVLLRIERMLLVVDDDPRPGRVGIGLERVGSENDVSPFEVVERRSTQSPSPVPSSAARNHSSLLSAPSPSSGNSAVELNTIASRTDSGSPIAQ